MIIFDAAVWTHTMMCGVAGCELYDNQHPWPLFRTHMVVRSPDEKQLVDRPEGFLAYP